VSLDLRVHGDGTPLFGFAATFGRGAAAIARVGDEVRIGPVTPGALAGPLLGSLTPLPAGPDRPANVSAADFAVACAEGKRDGPAGFQRALRHAGVRGSEAATVARVLTARQGGGQLGATGRDRRAVNWVDTPDGRYALRHNGELGHDHPGRPAPAGRDGRGDAGRGPLTV
jgi:ESX secretion-associated protein EspG